MRPPRPASSRGQKGVILIWMAFFMIVMLMFIALGVDMAKLMATRSQLQNAADAAALAGAYAFATEEGEAARTLATEMAIATAARNKAFQQDPTSVVLSAADVSVDLDSQTVAVTVRRDSSAGTPMVAHFLQVLGMGRLNVRASAIAKADGGDCDLWPVAGQPGPGQTMFVEGCTEYILKNGGGSGTQGSYGALDLAQLDCDDPPSAGTGAAAYRTYLRLGFHCCVDSGTCIPREAGNMSGPTTDGIEYRFLRDTDQRQGICYWKDFPNRVKEYGGNGSRVIVVPVTGPEEGCGYRVQHYGRFFLTRIPASGNRNLIYANYLGRDDGTGGGAGTGNGFHVWLIK